jgi:hypothetical protein
LHRYDNIPGYDAEADPMAKSSHGSNVSFIRSLKSQQLSKECKGGIFHWVREKKRCKEDKEKYG